MFCALKFLILISLTQVLSMNMNPNVLRMKSQAQTSENSLFSTQMKEKDIFDTLDNLENFYDHKNRDREKNNFRYTDLAGMKGATNIKSKRALQLKIIPSPNHLRKLRLPDLSRKFRYNEFEARNLLRRLTTEKILELLRKVTKPAHRPAVRSDPRKGHAGVHTYSSERSVEIFDPEAPGKIHYGESSLETDHEEAKEGVFKKPWHMYPYYDFWTYKRPYIAGECPGNQIRVNGYCVELPPH